MKLLILLFLIFCTSLFSTNLDYLLEEYDKEGKTHVVIGIGCTGGQHRSVSLTNYFADHYSQKYHVHRLHRDAVH